MVIRYNQVPSTVYIKKKVILKNSNNRTVARNRRTKLTKENKQFLKSLGFQVL